MEDNIKYHIRWSNGKEFKDSLNTRRIYATRKEAEQTIKYLSSTIIKKGENPIFLEIVEVETEAKFNINLLFKLLFLQLDVHNNPVTNKWIIKLDKNPNFIQGLNKLKKFFIDLDLVNFKYTKNKVKENPFSANGNKIQSCNYSPSYKYGNTPCVLSEVEEKEYLN